jgi:hypothetical protein
MQESIETGLERLRQSRHSADQDFLNVHSRYLESRDPADAILPPISNHYPFEQMALARRAACGFTTDQQARDLAEIALLNLGNPNADHPFAEAFLDSAISTEKDRQLAFPTLVEIAGDLGISAEIFASVVAAYCPATFSFGWTTRELGPVELPAGALPSGITATLTEDVPPEAFTDLSPVEKYLYELPDEVLGVALTAKRQGRYSEHKPSDKMIASVAKLRPDAILPWMALAECGKRGGIAEWTAILKATDRWDAAMLRTLEIKHPSEAILILSAHTETGRMPFLDRIRELAMHPEQRELPTALELLASFSPADFIPHFLVTLDSGALANRMNYSTSCERIFAIAAARWTDGGKRVFEKALDGAGKDGARLMIEAVDGLLADPAAVPAGDAEAWLRKAQAAIEATAGVASEEVVDFWNHMNRLAPALLVEERFSLLGHRNKTLRALAIPGVRTLSQDIIADRVRASLDASNANSRMGAAELLAELKSESLIPLIRDAIAAERSEKVRDALLLALRASGGEIQTDEGETQDTKSLLADIESAAKNAKPPKTGLHNLATLPVLRTVDGAELSQAVAIHLIARQSRQKTIEAAPDILPLLAHIDRDSSAPFAAALVEGFLNSDQAASDRWALTLGGLLGDNRIIPPLLSRIKDWCENSRHKLAEYAAQAISLLPGNEPLMVLDTLSNRYRSKFKNVGKACADAFNAAATARGITADELGDLVVPDFGFDADGIRQFEWPGGAISAELTPDFKLTWFDPESGKSWKSLPATAPDAVITEVKTLTKLLRETVKGQTARLEMTLVRQRRWPVTRWRELYENHPLLRSFASSLVWGVYDHSGTLLRTFRRYPNGLLADATGNLDELPESETLIGMVHPLEMDGSFLDAWRGHLARFKVKQPFPQIDRPVEYLNPLHANRKSITLTEGKKLSAGTFKSRAEKRGWTRGSVVDAGGISSYYKLYPGAGIEAVLPLNGFYIGCDPMEEIELEPAYFATAGTVARGSYIYDEPAPDDPRILRFNQAPAVVFSETLADLKAITETKP